MYNNDGAVLRGGPFNVGDRVRIERDETRYPSQGTWPQFRNRTSTVVEINRDHKHPHLTEYGVVFGKTRRRPDGSLHGDDVTTWFKVYELRVIRPALASQGPSAGSHSLAATGSIWQQHGWPSGGCLMGMKYSKSKVVRQTSDGYLGHLAEERECGDDEERFQRYLASTEGRS
jgi:hypothetical protein